MASQFFRVPITVLNKVVHGEAARSDGLVDDGLGLAGHLFEEGRPNSELDLVGPLSLVGVEEGVEVEVRGHHHTADSDSDFFGFVCHETL